MGQFAGLFYTGNAQALRGVYDAPYHVMGRHALCARGIASDGGAMALVVGRLRNAAALRNEVRPLGEKYTASDSALLLGAYRLWGEDCAEKLEGEALLVVIDQDAERLILSSDRMGAAGALFYAPARGGVAFAGHPEPLLRVPGVSRRIAREGLRMLFGLGPARTPGLTPLRDVFQLPPGTMLIADRHGHRTRRWFRLEARAHEDDGGKTIDTVRGLLEQAVDDAAVCRPVSMLSGGLDSTVLTALLARRGGEVRSFSVDYEGNADYFKGGRYQPEQDAPYVDRAVQVLHCRHTRVVLSVDALADTLDEAVLARGFPGMADIDSSLLLFSRAIAKHGQYALSGECSDEVFGGYPWFNREELIFADGFPWSGSLALRESVLREDVRDELRLPAYVDSVYHEALARQSVLPGEDARSARLRLLQGLCFEFFMSNLQERAACMGEASGLTVLTPYCDDRLVQYVYNVPWTLKRMMGVEKGLLRAAMRDLLPEELLMRRKSPYPKTYHPAYAQAIKQRMAEVLEDSSAPILALIDRQTLSGLIHSNLSPAETPWFGQLMAGPQMLAYLLQINFWMSRYGVEISQ